MRSVRYVVAVAVWCVAGYVSLWIAANTKIGPVVAEIRGTHGVHEGDVVVVVVAAAVVASIVSVAALRRPRP